MADMSVFAFLYSITGLPNYIVLVLIYKALGLSSVSFVSFVLFMSLLLQPVVVIPANVVTSSNKRYPFTV